MAQICNGRPTKRALGLFQEELMIPQGAKNGADMADVL
jgi:hypothetical protein